MGTFSPARIRALRERASSFVSAPREAGFCPSRFPGGGEAFGGGEVFMVFSHCERVAEGAETGGDESEGGFGGGGFDFEVIAARGSEGEKLDGNLSRGFVGRIAGVDTGIARVALSWASNEGE